MSEPRTEHNYKTTLTVTAYKCSRCGHEWIPRLELNKLLKGDISKEDEPIICPNCKTPYWKTPRKNKKNGKRV